MLQRLGGRPQFEAAINAGAAARSEHFVLHRARAAQAEPRIGVVLPKRWARRAVTRNMLRRQIYACAQAAADTLPPANTVVRLRAAFAPSQFKSASSSALRQAVRSELARLFSNPKASA